MSTSARHSRRRGSVAVMALAALVVLTTIVLLMLTLSIASINSGARQKKLMALRALAEAGAQYGYWQVVNKAATLPYTISNRALGAGTFAVTVTDNNATITGSLKIVSTATIGTDSLTITRYSLNQSLSVAGTVFEDINYGGGAGRSLTGSGGTKIANATVELYDAAGNYIGYKTTDSNGAYSHSGVLASTTYSLRVVNGSLFSSRTGATASLLGVQTFATSASAGSTTAITDHVGGADPTKVDAGAGSSGVTLTSLTSGSVKPQTVVSVASSGTNVTGVDFGFNFDTVVNTNDTGQGSLRQCLTNANALSNTGLAQSGRTAGIESVVFMIPDGTARAGMNTGYANQFSGGVATIALASALPTISDPLILDGQTQPGWSSNPIVELNGTSAGSGVSGLTVSASGCTLRGLTINRFPANGILLQSASNSLVQGCFVGTNNAGTSASANTQAGIRVSGGSSSSIGGTTAAQRNIISGNGQWGVRLEASAASTVVQGNYIGLDVNGATAIGNGDDGVRISTGVTASTIGGTATGAGNVISGNTGSGNGVQVGISGETGISGNVIVGNTIGLNAAGTAAVPNALSGISLEAGSSTTVGGTTSSARNIISGNTQQGISIGTTGNTIQGNYIGTNSAGTGALGNKQNGIYCGAASNTIGGTATGAGNLISGNTQNGIQLAADSSTVQGNTIGLNAAGTAALANSGAGLYVTSANNTIGGTSSTARNVISGNTSYGICFTGTAATGNLVQGCYIGTNAAGTGAAANGSHGVYMDNCSNNTLGGTTAGASCVVSGNTGAGIYLANSSGITTGVAIKGCYIGTNAAGTGAVANRLSGILLDNVSSNTIGGTAAGSGNLISGNTQHGIHAYKSNGSATAVTTANTIQGNTIGLNAAGTAALANGQYGILINGLSNYTVGGTAAGAGNVCSGNTYYGIALTGSGCTGCVVQGNYCGTNAAGTGAVANGWDGVGFESGASNNTVGGTTAAARNILSGNAGRGVWMQDSTTTSNKVQGNYIGLNAAGTATLGNTQDGVYINGCPSNTIGGTTAGAGNVISGNGLCGISINASTATGNVVQGNYIGVNPAGTADFGNNDNGITILNAPSNTIGGTSSSARNVISGNTNSGIYVNTSGGSVSGTVIQGNYLGTNAAGTAAIANGLNGVCLNASNGITIGGTATGAGNLLSGNGSRGIQIGGTGGTNTVQGNTIGLNAAGTAAIANGSDGIILYSGTTTVGGTAAGAGNVISGNNGIGIRIWTGVSGTIVQGNYIGTNATATAGVANTQQGIYCQGSNSSIGGTAAGAGNVIAYNASQGVDIVSGTGNAILGNSIYANGGAGIDLNNDGITVNNGTKNSGYPNYDMDTPVFTNALLSGTSLSVSGYVGSAANQTTFASARVEIFKSDNDSSGYGEGKTYLGYLTTDSSGNFSGTLTVSGINPYDIVTATATDGSNNTSEFGPNFTVLGNYIFSYAFYPSASFSNSAYAFITGSASYYGDVRCNGSLSLTNASTVINGSASATGTLNVTSATGTKTSGFPSFTFPSMTASYYQGIASYSYPSSIFNGGYINYGYSNIVIYISGDLYINGATTFAGTATVFVNGNVYLNASCSYADSSSKLVVLCPNTLTINTGANTLIGFWYGHNASNTASVTINQGFTLNGALVVDKIGTVTGSGTIRISRDFAMTPALGNAMHIPGY